MRVLDVQREWVNQSELNVVVSGTGSQVTVQFCEYVAELSARGESWWKAANYVTLSNNTRQTLPINLYRWWWSGGWGALEAGGRYQIRFTCGWCSESIDNNNSTRKSVIRVRGWYWINWRHYRQFAHPFDEPLPHLGRGLMMARRRRSS